MRTLLFKHYLLIVFIGMFGKLSFAQSISAVSFNIRYDSPNDGANIWELRKDGLTRLLHNLEPDVIGTQEGLKHQLDFVQSALSNYKMIGVDREDNGKGEYSSIFYNTNALKLIDSNTFWLSPTPDSPSKGWDAALNRICTYGIFENKTSGKRFLVLNTHYDHMGNTARKESSKLIIKKIEEFNPDQLPVLLLGDFNSEPKNAPIQTILKVLKDGQQISKTKTIGPIGTYSGFDTQAKLNRRIDYIFTKDLIVLSYKHLADRLSNGNWPSDHLPVYIKVKL